MFDGKDFVETTPELKTINWMIALLSDPKRWTKGEPKYGTDLGPHCLVTSANGHFYCVDRAVNSAVQEFFPGRCFGCGDLVSFNEHCETTHADVMRVLHRAREILLSSQSR